ncbi:unnamed protein product [Prorocentrum cordatum]|uniref:Uncharacterized protein n=1 Tax=Prorocentrum cordatum TaxID=2364126 RepID=A0ABN9WBG1_9DINO|nr:unnamed protein product [Polarella glacialis]
MSLHEDKTLCPTCGWCSSPAGAAAAAGRGHPRGRSISRVTPGTGKIVLQTETRAGGRLFFAPCASERTQRGGTEAAAGRHVLCTGSRLGDDADTATLPSRHGDAAAGGRLRRPGRSGRPRALSFSGGRGATDASARCGVGGAVGVEIKSWLIRVAGEGDESALPTSSRAGLQQDIVVLRLAKCHQQRRANAVFAVRGRGSRSLAFQTVHAEGVKTVRADSAPRGWLESESSQKLWIPWLLGRPPPALQLLLSAWPVLPLWGRLWRHPRAAAALSPAGRGRCPASLSPLWDIRRTFASVKAAKLPAGRWPLAGPQGDRAGGRPPAPRTAREAWASAVAIASFDAGGVDAMAWVEAVRVLCASIRRHEPPGLRRPFIGGPAGPHGGGGHGPALRRDLRGGRHPPRGCRRGDRAPEPRQVRQRATAGRGASISPFRAGGLRPHRSAAIDADALVVGPLSHLFDAPPGLFLAATINGTPINTGVMVITPSQDFMPALFDVLRVEAWEEKAGWAACASDASGVAERVCGSASGGVFNAFCTQGLIDAVQLALSDRLGDAVWIRQVPEMSYCAPETPDNILGWSLACGLLLGSSSGVSLAARASRGCLARLTQGSPQLTAHSSRVHGIMSLLGLAGGAPVEVFTAAALLLWYWLRQRRRLSKKDLADYSAPTGQLSGNRVGGSASQHDAAACWALGHGRYKHCGLREDPLASTELPVVSRTNIDIPLLDAECSAERKQMLEVLSRRVADLAELVTGCMEKHWLQLLLLLLPCHRPHPPLPAPLSPCWNTSR